LKTACLALAALALPATAALAQAPDGGEFLVNAYRTGVQSTPAVAKDESGNFVVVWTSYGQDGSYDGVFGQRFGPSGLALGPEFQVNTYTTGFQRTPSVAADGRGNFVVAWAAASQDGSAYGVFARRYDALGVPIGGEILVNTYTIGDQVGPAVAADKAGNFVVVWGGRSQGDLFSVSGQRFDAIGFRQGGEFRANTYTTGAQGAPSVAFGSNGSFLVVWTSDTVPSQDGSSAGVFAQCYDASGAPLGGEFQVNSYTTSKQATYGHPAVAGGGNGTFVVVWQSAYQDGDDFGVVARRLDASSCAFQGPEFLVNAATTGRQAFATVAADEKGEFTVVWESVTSGGYGYEIFARRFDNLGVSQGGEFRVNTSRLGDQTGATVAANPDGDFVVVWNGPGPEATPDILAQRYGDLIFEEDFESGFSALGRWSSASTGGGDLSVSPLAALAGTSAGMRALVNDTGSLFVQDDSPSDEARYRARFYFDPNGFDPGEASAHFRARLFLAQGGGFRLVTIVLKRQGGAYSVEARARSNSGARIDTGFKPITDAAHVLEFDWQRATGPGAADGSLELWIDGVSVATLAGIDNDAFGVDQARLGALSLKTGASGALFFDQFESRRLDRIGPE